MRVLVTGSAGHLGEALARTLLVTASRNRKIPTIRSKAARAIGAWNS
jgi:hypothetical protein